MRKTKTTAAPKADPQNKELVEAIRALCQEKDLSEDMLFATVEDALKKAYAKNRAKGEAEPSANNISATIDRATGEIHVYTRRLIPARRRTDRQGRHYAAPARRRTRQSV